MKDKSGIKVIRKNGTDNTFEVTINERSPIEILSDYVGDPTEDHIHHILKVAQEKAHNHIQTMPY